MMTAHLLQKHFLLGHLLIKNTVCLSRMTVKFKLLVKVKDFEFVNFKFIKIKKYAPVAVVLMRKLHI